MSKHIVPQDSYNHIEDVACGCNPTVVVSEGEESYIHKEISDKKLDIVDGNGKHYWISYEDYKAMRKLRSYID